ncbi:helix-turn-helix domain-containing protein [Castellaniella sp.]|uniref:helix-turn-helix domain-containing protein n=1 Tax=Castellaniella sp. TaxID=1955812 RepID=UPI003C759AFB
MSGQVVWALAQADSAWLRSLVSVGCRVMSFPDAPALRRAAGRPGAGEPAALVLLADLASNCRAAQSARLAWPGLSLVAWHGQQVGPEQAALLSAGVDYVLRPGDPTDLLVSVLMALAYRRVRFGATVPPGLFAQPGQAGADLRIGPWRLADLGWALEYEDALLRLTVSERALLLCLFEAPGHVASHADLIAAVLQVWQPRQQARIRDPRCRSIISRLRQRACGAGMPAPPIESLRDFGYAWAL